MRRKTIRIFLLASLFFAGRGLFPDDAKKEPPPPAPTIRVEAWLVAMPETKFLELLPDLRDDAKIGGAVTQILEAVKRKEMILRGCPMIVALNGQRAESGVKREIKDTMDPAPDIPLIGDTEQSIPIGVLMEVEPSFDSMLSPDRWIIDLNIVVQDMEVPKGDENTTTMLSTITKDCDPKNTPDRPAYVTMKTTASLALRDGHYALFATHKMIQPGGYVEVVVIRAVVVPVETK